VSDGDAGARHDGVALPTIWIFYSDRARYAAGMFTFANVAIADERTWMRWVW
jgi:hypothetical protein